MRGQPCVANNVQCSLNSLNLSFQVATGDVRVFGAVEIIVVVARQISVLQLPGHVPADHAWQPVCHLAQDVGYCQERQLDVAVWFPEHDHGRFHDCLNPKSGLVQISLLFDLLDHFPLFAQRRVAPQVPAGESD